MTRTNLKELWCCGNIKCTTRIAKDMSWTAGKHEDHAFCMQIVERTCQTQQHVMNKRWDHGMILFIPLVFNSKCQWSVKTMKVNNHFMQQQKNQKKITKAMWWIRKQWENGQRTFKLSLFSTDPNFVDYILKGNRSGELFEYIQMEEKISIP